MSSNSHPSATANKARNRLKWGVIVDTEQMGTSYNFDKYDAVHLMAISGKIVLIMYANNFNKSPNSMHFK